jgi:glycosyltransferase involved in cell wall biosynthesis
VERDGNGLPKLFLACFKPPKLKTRFIKSGPKDEENCGNSMKCHHVHYVQSLEPLQGGGLGAAALQLHQALRLNGRQSNLVSTRDKSTPPTADAEEFIRRGPTKLFYAPGLRRRADELAQAEEAIFHAHGFYVYPNAVLGAAARRQDRALVCHPHGMFEPWILKRSRIKKKVAHLLYENANFRAARLWRALSLAEADQIRSQGITAPVVVIPNGIDLTSFNSFPPPGKPLRTILFLGRLHPKKGIDLLLGAWKHWSARFPEWRLVLAGPDEGGYAQTIKAIILTEMIERVELLGAVMGDKKIQLLATAGIFSLPSYSEGFPMAVLEAMAARRPVLATHECHIPQVGSAGAGWLCEASNESVNRALGEALQVSDEERDQRGAAGRRLVEREFQWPHLAAQLHEACEKL